MKKLLIWDFDDDFTPAEFYDDGDPCDECFRCPFHHWNDEYGNGWCGCDITNGSEPVDDEELKALGVEFKCPLYDLFFE